MGTIVEEMIAEEIKNKIEIASGKYCEGINLPLVGYLPLLAYQNGAQHVLSNLKDFGLMEISELKKYAELIQDIYDICLCERFETYGFDYHEKHPKRSANNRGARPKTPRDLVEHRIGFDWRYENPFGTCRSWRVLRLNGFERKEMRK